jgi:hypothetical protein
MQFSKGGRNWDHETSLFNCRSPVDACVSSIQPCKSIYNKGNDSPHLKMLTGRKDTFEIQIEFS